MSAVTWPQIILGLLIAVDAICWAHILRDLDRHSWAIAYLLGVNRRQAARIRDLSVGAGLPVFDDAVDQPERPGTFTRLREWLHTAPGDPQPEPEPAPEPVRPRPAPGPRTVPTAQAIDRWQTTEMPAPTGLVEDVEFARILAELEASFHEWRLSRESES